MKKILSVLFAVFLTITCGESTERAKALHERANAVFAPLPAQMPGSEADSAELIALGKELFTEKGLSINDSQSCASCHVLAGGRAGVDNDATSVGAGGKRGGRNSPTVYNAGFHIAQFWDGRAADLKAQAKGPILNPIEMGMPDEATVIAKLAGLKNYKALFGKAYPKVADPLTYDNLAGAIAAFERTLITKDRFDDFLRGDLKALDQKELAGLALFMNLGCTACHNGPAIGGRMYQKLGVHAPYANQADMGRFELTKNESDKMIFKTPSLRNIALTGPYFHDGGIETLSEAVQTMAGLQLGKKLKDDEVNSIISFLETLSGAGLK